MIFLKLLVISCKPTQTLQANHWRMDRNTCRLNLYVSLQLSVRMMPRMSSGVSMSPTGRFTANLSISAQPTPGQTPKSFPCSGMRWNWVSGTPWVTRSALQGALRSPRKGFSCCSLFFFFFFFFFFLSICLSLSLTFSPYHSPPSSPPDVYVYRVPWWRIITIRLFCTLWIISKVLCTEGAFGIDSQTLDRNGGCAPTKPIIMAEVFTARSRKILTSPTTRILSLFTLGRMWNWWVARLSFRTPPPTPSIFFLNILFIIFTSYVLSSIQHILKRTYANVSLPAAKVVTEAT